MSNAGLTTLRNFREPLFVHLYHGDTTTIYLLVKGGVQQAMPLAQPLARGKGSVNDVSVCVCVCASTCM